MDENFIHLTDEQLVARVRDGQHRAFDHIAARHHGRIRWMLAAKLPDAEVDDLVQDVLLDVFDAVAGDREITHFRAWLNQLVRNTIADIWRGRQGRRIEFSREAAQRDELPGDERAVEGGYGEWETWSVVDQVLAGLSDTHREIVERYVIDQADAAEVARLAGTSEDNVYQVARRFRVELRRQLEADPDDNED